MPAQIKGRGYGKTRGEGAGRDSFSKCEIQTRAATASRGEIPIRTGDRRCELLCFGARRLGADLDLFNPDPHLAFRRPCLGRPALAWAAPLSGPFFRVIPPLAAHR